MRQHDARLAYCWRHWQRLAVICCAIMLLLLVIERQVVTSWPSLPSPAMLELNFH